LIREAKLFREESGSRERGLVTVDRVGALCTRLQGQKA
jgi:hypothetical protein